MTTPFRTDIFDTIIAALLKTEGAENVKIATIEAVIKRFEKEGWKDWDQSQFFMNPLVQIALKKHQGLK